MLQGPHPLPEQKWSLPKVFLMKRFIAGVFGHQHGLVVTLLLVSSSHQQTGLWNTLAVPRLPLCQSQRILHIPNHPGKNRRAEQSSSDGHSSTSTEIHRGFTERNLFLLPISMFATISCCCTLNTPCNKCILLLLLCVCSTHISREQEATRRAETPDTHTRKLQVREVSLGQQLK